MTGEVPHSQDGRHPYHKPPETTVFQKLMIILAFTITLVLSGLTASLPLNLRRHQADMASPPADDTTINNGDTAWMIVATIFGILLGPVTAYFYGENLFCGWLAARVSFPLPLKISPAAETHPSLTRAPSPSPSHLFFFCIVNSEHLRKAVQHFGADRYYHGLHGRLPLDRY